MMKKSERWQKSVTILMALGLVAPIAAPPVAEAAVVLCERRGKIKLRQDECKRKESQVDAAELGIVGPQGPEGMEGPAGAPGGTDVIVRTQSFGSTPGGVHVVFRVMCEGGEVAVGGGAGFAGNGGNEELQQSYPVNAEEGAAEDGDTPAGWASIIKNNNGTPLIGTGYVLCASP
jgi:hypothetical protein